MEIDMNSAMALSDVETLRVRARTDAVERAAKKDRESERIAIDSYREAIRSLDGRDAGATTR